MSETVPPPGAAEILYGASAPAPTPGEGSAPAPGPSTPPAADLAARRAELNEKREAIEAEGNALRDAERAAEEAAEEQPTAAEVLFGDPASIATTYAPVLRESVDTIIELNPEAAAQRDEIMQNTSVVFHDAGIQPEAASVLHGIVVRSIKSLPTDEDVAAWETESKAYLARKFPNGGSEKPLAAARAFVAARPELAKVLASGAGSHPQIVAALIEAAEAGKLRIKPRKTK